MEVDGGADDDVSNDNSLSVLLLDADGVGFDSDTTSNRCGVDRASSIAIGSARSTLAISAIVSVQALKFGGEDTHPIGFVRGIPTSLGSPGRDGNNAARCIVSSGRSHSL